MLLSKCCRGIRKTTFLKIVHFNIVMTSRAHCCRLSRDAVNDDESRQLTLAGPFPELRFIRMIIYSRLLSGIDNCLVQILLSGMVLSKKKPKETVSR